VIAHAEGAVNGVEEVDDAFYFRFNLRRQAEDMGVILGEAADPHEPVEAPLSS
jgi:hypothetical protein